MTHTTNRLHQLRISGFRSIKDAEIEFRPLNVFIGANGAGKSNLVDFFRLVNYALSRGLQDPYMIERGPASNILHFGPNQTKVVDAEMIFEGERGRNYYRFTLAHARQDDTFIYTNDEVQFHPIDSEDPQPSIPVGPSGHRESGLAEVWSDDNPTIRCVKHLVAQCRVYQFHDTGIDSRLRNHSPYEDDNRFLRADGGNLPAVLYRLQEEMPAVFREILRTVQAILPWLDALILKPDDKKRVPLRWRMKGKANYDLVAGQLSDGSLRILALVTLLLLPESIKAGVLVIDEPELGLHPSGESIIAGLIKSASRTGQIVLCTQSASFLDHFSADDVLVTESEKGCTSFERQSEEELARWRERYTLSQIWNKNIIGGRP